MVIAFGHQISISQAGAAGKGPVPILALGSKKAEEQKITVRNLTLVLHRTARASEVEVHCSTFSLFSVTLLGEKFLQMATSMLSPMVVNFPSLLCSFSENVSERVTDSRKVTFLAE